jgi:hypothetical protein
VNALAIDPSDSATMYAAARAVFVLDPGSPCGTAPQLGCKTPVRAHASRLRLVGSESGATDRVVWNWRHRARTSDTELGDPTSRTDFLLCVYAESATTSQLVLQVSAPEGPNGSCGGVPCWQQVRGGFRYVDPTGGSDGLRDLVVQHTTAVAEPRIKLKASGPNLHLSLPPPRTSRV